MRSSGLRTSRGLDSEYSKAVDILLQMPMALGKYSSPIVPLHPTSLMRDRQRLTNAKAMMNVVTSVTQKAILLDGVALSMYQSST